MADPENFGGGDLKHKTSKIRMSSPKLRVIFWPKSEFRGAVAVEYSSGGFRGGDGMHPPHPPPPPPKSATAINE